MKEARVRLNVDAVNELIKEKFRNNKSWFAEEIGVNGSYFIQVLNKKEIDHSPKIINGVVDLCKKNGLDPNNYIFLE
jgi:hypothetical protein